MHSVSGFKTNMYYTDIQWSRLRAFTHRSVVAHVSGMRFFVLSGLLVGERITISINLSSIFTAWTSTYKAQKNLRWIHAFSYWNKLIQFYLIAVHVLYKWWMVFWYIRSDQMDLDNISKMYGGLWCRLLSVFRLPILQQYYITWDMFFPDWNPWVEQGIQHDIY